MKKITMIVVAVIAILVACQKESQKAQNVTGKTNTGNVTQTDDNKQLSGGAGVNIGNSGSSAAGENYIVLKTVPLLAGQTLPVGTVTVANDDEYVYVSYNITLPVWKISELHLYLGDSTEIPANNSGNPVPGQFPNKITFKKVKVSSYTFAFPREDLGECFSVAAHCVVSGGGSETAWGQGSLFPNANQWGMFFNVCTTPVGPPKG